MSTLKIITASALSAVVANDRSRIYLFKQVNKIGKEIDRFLEKPKKETPKKEQQKEVDENNDERSNS